MSVSEEKHPSWCHDPPGISINTLRLRQNGCHFAADIFQCIFLNENVWIPINISLKFVPKGPINDDPALVQIRAWHRPGDKPLSEPVMVCLPTHICFTGPQWVKQSYWDWWWNANMKVIVVKIHTWNPNIKTGIIYEFQYKNNHVELSTEFQYESKIFAYNLVELASLPA